MTRRKSRFGRTDLRCELCRHRRPPLPPIPPPAPSPNPNVVVNIPPELVVNIPSHDPSWAWLAGPAATIIAAGLAIFGAALAYFGIKRQIAAGWAQQSRSERRELVTDAAAFVDELYSLANLQLLYSGKYNERIPPSEAGQAQGGGAVLRAAGRTCVRPQLGLAGNARGV